MRGLSGCRSLEYLGNLGILIGEVGVGFGWFSTEIFISQLKEIVDLHTIKYEAFVGNVEGIITPRRRWGRCWGGLSCFRPQKGGRRVAPASRIQEGNTSANRANGTQPVGPTSQATSLTPSLLAPPSSPASFTNSALPSTVQSPSCFLSLSANSPGGPSHAMYATGPYAHETQLVSPPVFSTFTTEPSTAPLTPPPELNHPTTPSSPDVPFAQFLSSSMDLRSASRSRYVLSSDLQTTYPLHPGSSGSSLISPVSGDALSSSFPEREFPSLWGATQDSQYPRSASSRLFGGIDTPTSKNFMLSQDSSFFYPATSAQFYLDQAQQALPPYGGRLSLSRETDVYSNNGNSDHHNRHNKTCKTDVEEIEAYRASFGFSADEIITTPQYVEISDVHDESFTITPFTSTKTNMELRPVKDMLSISQGNFKSQKLASEQVTSRVNSQLQDDSCKGHEDNKKAGSGKHSKQITSDDEDIISKMGSLRTSRRYRSGLSISDAEIDYRRGRSLREGRRDLAWCE
ncbi:hypothetical protein GIB67_036081 [Kingdonia uniflora]|uniref:Hydroxyproline-rich glycoprotein family protein n=1 Tax=Kingdonia uniflora TaxID=39325 RepID=A0A7J7N8R0_9MAGN|nr:hypothetical protein GIB67_036081 [Kingdonia uniflora]